MVRQAQALAGRFWHGLATAVVAGMLLPAAAQAQAAGPFGITIPSGGCGVLTEAEDARGSFRAVVCSTGVNVMSFEPTQRPASLQALVEMFAVPPGRDQTGGPTLEPWPEDLEAIEGGEGWRLAMGEEGEAYMLLAANWGSGRGRVVSCMASPVDPPGLCTAYLERALQGLSLEQFEPEDAPVGLRQQAQSLLDSQLRARGIDPDEPSVPRLLGTSLTVPEGCRTDATALRPGKRIGCADSLLRVWTKASRVSGAAALRAFVEQTVQGNGPGQIAADMALEGQPFECLLLGQRATCLQHEADGETARIAYRLAGDNVIIASCARREPHDTWEDLCEQVLTEP